MQEHLFSFAQATKRWFYLYKVLQLQKSLLNTELDFRQECENLLCLISSSAGTKFPSAQSVLRATLNALVELYGDAKSQSRQHPKEWHKTAKATSLQRGAQHTTKRFIVIPSVLQGLTWGGRHDRVRHTIEGAVGHLGCECRHGIYEGTLRSGGRHQGCLLLQTVTLETQQNTMTQNSYICGSDLIPNCRIKLHYLIYGNDKFVIYKNSSMNFLDSRKK